MASLVPALARASRPAQGGATAWVPPRPLLAAPESASPLRARLARRDRRVHPRRCGKPGGFPSACPAAYAASRRAAPANHRRRMASLGQLIRSDHRLALGGLAVFANWLVIAHIQRTGCKGRCPALL